MRPWTSWTCADIGWQNICTVFSGKNQKNKNCFTYPIFPYIFDLGSMSWNVSVFSEYWSGLSWSFWWRYWEAVNSKCKASHQTLPLYTLETLNVFVLNVLSSCTGSRWSSDCASKEGRSKRMERGCCRLSASWWLVAFLEWTVLAALYDECIWHLTLPIAFSAFSLRWARETGIWPGHCGCSAVPRPDVSTRLFCVGELHSCYRETEVSCIKNSVRLAITLFTMNENKFQKV